MTGRHKILAADKLSRKGLDFVAGRNDAELTYRPGLNEDELAAIVGQYDGMIVRSSTKVSSKVLANPGRLRAVARAGVGVDNIDLTAATAAGVLVMNSAEASTMTTAEHAFALLLGLARHIGPAYKSMTEGAWDRQCFEGRQLSGKTIGIVGFGRIGQAVACRAMAFDMQVVAYDPFFNASSAMDGRVKLVPQVADLWPLADVLSFHVPLNEQTRQLLDRQAFALCRQGVMVINASRGGVVDEEAVLEALETNKCAGAALDVFSQEPLTANSPLRQHPAILLTPHLGASTVEAQEAVVVDAAVALLDYLGGQAVRGAINVVGLRLDLDPVQERFVDLARRMAMLLSPMVTEGFSCVSIELAGQALTGVSTTLERMALIGLLQPHMDTPLNLVNVRHVAESRGIKLRSVTVDEAKMNGPLIAIEVESDRRHRIVGRIYDDLRPRVVEINGYHMDMVPAGNMLLIRNDDRPGMIGLVGTQFGDAGINIADMAISRRDRTALMLLRVDQEPESTMAERLAQCQGIDRVAFVKLPTEENASEET